MNHTKCFDNACLRTKFHQSETWSSLDASDLRKVQQSAICCEINTGGTIYFEGDDCKGAYFVKEGLFGLRKEDQNGFSTLIRLVYSGETIGYRALIAKEQHRETAEALKPTTFCFLPGQVIIELIEKNPLVGLKLLAHSARLLGESQDRFHEAVTLNIRHRFSRLLLRLLEQYKAYNENGCPTQLDGSVDFEMPINRTELASMLGVRRESLSRVISELQTEELVKFSGRTVKILNYDNLLQYA